MHVTYGFVFYFMCLLIGLTLLLAFFAIRTIRKFFFRMADNFKLFENQFLIAAKYIAFAVILIILIDAVNTYISFSDVR